MNNLFDKITNQYSNKLPFVAYRKPNKKNISVFLMVDETLNFVSDFKERGFVFAPFNSDEKAILFSEEKALLFSEEVNLENSNLKDVFFTADNLSEERHIKIVEKAIKKINSSDLQKVVISREELVHLSNFDLLEIYKRLLSTYKNAFVYVWYHPKVGLWFGATPETLLNLEGTSFKTMSLAGTQIYNENKTAVWKSKELEEQQLVTDFIENQLEKIAKNLVINKIETVKAGNLLHLRTKVWGELESSSTVKELIRALHPTPAVCGLPRKISREFIFENEIYYRSFYTGFLGELNIQNSKEDKNSSSLFVNLRCMKIENNIASIFVGGGITKDSNAKKEWEETVSKAKTMKRVL
ncbi:chorismate-binding protein [Polaribacter sp. PL03]|uniref:chorismate-binding protein n=1 Tax=Polaribacter sp. PL03 TaxID=3088353 RepID=UPI0029CBC52A|nr:chorismate-binding protein [Polaribacter sp. PL03]MDX6747181.1 chorismate-binding protein [Polaribacter sp. PL03]